MFGLLGKLKGAAGLDAAQVAALAASLGIQLSIADLHEGSEVKEALRGLVAEAGAAGARVVSVEGKLKNGGTVRALLTLVG